MNLQLGVQALERIMKINMKKAVLGVAVLSLSFSCYAGKVTHTVNSAPLTRSELVNFQFSGCPTTLKDVSGKPQYKLRAGSFCTPIQLWEFVPAFGVWEPRNEYATYGQYEYQAKGTTFTQSLFCAQYRCSPSSQVGDPSILRLQHCPP